jgi:DnaJ-domain-containing protein 1
MNGKITVLMLFAVLLVLTPLVQAQALTNIVADGDFESGQSGNNGGWSATTPFQPHNYWTIQSHIARNGHALELIGYWDQPLLDIPVFKYDLPSSVSTPQVHGTDSFTFSVYFANDSAASTVSLALYNVTKPAVMYNDATAIQKQFATYFLEYYVTTSAVLPTHQTGNCDISMGRCWNGTITVFAPETYATYVIPQQPVRTWITITRNVLADLKARNITWSQLTYMNGTAPPDLIRVEPEPPALTRNQTHVQYYDDFALMVVPVSTSSETAVTTASTNPSTSPNSIVPSIAVEIFGSPLIVEALILTGAAAVVTFLVMLPRRERRRTRQGRSSSSPRVRTEISVPEKEPQYIIGEHELQSLMDDRDREGQLEQENRRLTGILEQLELENARLKEEGKPTIPAADPYAILAIPESATQQDVRTAYRRLAAIYHPDASKNPRSAEMFEVITDAYDRLIGGK